MSLTAPERVITFSDEDDTATVHTHQRRIITKLLNNPAAELIERIDFDGNAGAAFEIPADLINFRSGRRKMSPEQAQAGSPPRQGAASRLGSHRRFSSKAALLIIPAARQHRCGG